MPALQDSFSVRPYEADDAEATIDIFLRAIREVASKDYNPAQIAAWSKVDDAEKWAQYRASRPTWLAMDGSKPIGFTDLKSDGCLDMMFISPDHQGKGVASLLLATVENAAREQGLQRIFTEASLTARPFFERKGFVVVTAQQVEKRGQIFSNFLMEKTLA
ncbi:MULTISPECIES: GNAT family N-acetyltransferase [unclassified Rhizobium]|uniref:GNAT family N-acetyltransferase n=1 Tax=Rhizobium TaxID=379 RepID=UPI00084C67CE|nr:MULTISPECIES: GNAT family N-acetyltransferase [unclassified Rhizobium]OEC93126.1 acetyltransferase [Rhizobium sp. YK2]QYA12271.1 GNAT family N-acetyltransferase [Rhizobium sp. AB2/73]UEQ81798.1 GNAT family N-acetyltransferase [Rhizobium sp. AB2/73]